MVVQISTCEGAILRQKGTGQGHARTCPAVGILGATHQRVELVQCGCRLGVLDGVHSGATWRIRLNSLCATAMRLCGVMVKALACGSRGLEFNFRPFHFQVTTLGKLLTHMCLCHQAV